MSKAFCVPAQPNLSDKLGGCEFEVTPSESMFDVNMIASRWNICKRGVFRAVQRGELAPPVTIGRSARWFWGIFARRRKRSAKSVR